MTRATLMESEEEERNRHDVHSFIWGRKHVTVVMDLDDQDLREGIPEEKKRLISKYAVEKIPPGMPFRFL